MAAPVGLRARCGRGGLMSDRDPEGLIDLLASRLELPERAAYFRRGRDSAGRYTT